MAYQINVQYPNGQHLTFKFEQDTVYFGRIEGNDIRLAHSYISGRHFMVQQRGSAFWVSDVGSTNGTLVNGQPIEPHTPQPLGLGDVIQVGPLEIRVEPIVEATVIERTPSRIAASPSPSAPVTGPTPVARGVAASPPSRIDEAARTRFEDVPNDAPSPMWKVQTGMFRAQGDQVRVDDHIVAQPRGDLVNAGARPDLEQALRAATAGVATPALEGIPISSLTGGVVLQILGAALVVTCLVFLIAILLL